MNLKMMEGLVGARTNMNLMDKPMRVYREARRKGDTATMERAMGYVGEFADKAEKYKVEADKGIEEEAKEAREKAKLEREEAIRKRREEREKLEEKTEEGNKLLKENIDPDDTCADEIKTDMIKEPVTYTKTGEGEFVPAAQSSQVERKAWLLD